MTEPIDYFPMSILKFQLTYAVVLNLNYKLIMHFGIQAEIYDAAIIGGGPAGATAAYFLSSAGKKVILFEKQSLPRYKTCGGGIISIVNSILPFELKEVVENYCFRAELYDHRAELNFSSCRDKPIIMMVMRQEFDNYLLNKAKERGAEIFDETSVTDLRNLDEYVEVITSNSKIRANFLLAADGAAGIAVRKIGIKKYITRLPALENELFVKEDIYEKYKYSARFDFDIIPFGYGWVFPKDHHLSVGVVRMKKGKTNLNFMLEKYLNKLGIKDIIKAEKHGFYIPVGCGLKTYVNDRIILTGDAAALADPVTGEGISSAILSGKYAAQAVIECNYKKKHLKNIYDGKIKSSIIREHNYAKIISELVYTYPHIRTFLFKKYGKKLVEMMTDIIMGEKKYSKMLTSPHNYYKLLKYFFTGTG